MSFDNTLMKHNYIKTLSLTEDRSFRIWMGLIALSLSSLLLAESQQPGMGITAIICLLVLFKGRWVIDHFMGLKHACAITRRVVKSYFYTMVCIIGLAVSYSQYLQADRIY